MNKKQIYITIAICLGILLLVFLLTLFSQSKLAKTSLSLIKNQFDRNSFGILKPNYTWKSVEGPKYSLVRYIAQKENQPNVIYAAALSGIYKSTTYGQTWNKRFDGSAKKVILDSFRVNVMYASMQKHGVIKSDDFGNTWREINQGIEGDNGIIQIKDLVVDTGNVGTLYTLSDQDGIYKSTDSGENWQKVGPSEIDTANIVLDAITINPFDSDHVIAIGHGKIGPMRLGSVLYETRNGGSNWTENKRSDLYFASDIEFSYSDPQYLFACFDGKLYRALVGENNNYSFEKKLNDYKGQNVGITVSKDYPNLVIAHSIRYLAISNNLGKLFYSFNIKQDTDSLVYHVSSNYDNPVELLIGTERGFMRYNVDTNDYSLFKDFAQGSLRTIGFSQQGKMLAIGNLNRIFYRTDDDTWNNTKGNASVGNRKYNSSDLKNWILNEDTLIYWNNKNHTPQLLKYDFDTKQTTKIWRSEKSILNVYPISESESLVSTGLLVFGPMELWNSNSNEIENDNSSNRPYDNFVSAGNYIYCISENKILRKTNDANSWDIVHTFEDQDLINHLVFDANKNRFFAVLDKSLVFKGSGNLQNWEEINIPESEKIETFFADNSSNLWIGYENKGIFTSKNNGLRWKNMNYSLEKDSNENIKVTSIAQHPVTKDIYIVINGKIKKLVEQEFKTFSKIKKAL